jgi:hypothetical protein
MQAGGPKHTFVSGLLESVSDFVRFVLSRNLERINARAGCPMRGAPGASWRQVSRNKRLGPGDPLSVVVKCKLCSLGEVSIKQPISALVVLRYRKQDLRFSVAVIVPGINKPHVSAEEPHLCLTEISYEHLVRAAPQKSRISQSVGKVV